MTLDCFKFKTGRAFTPLSRPALAHQRKRLQDSELALYRICSEAYARGTCGL